MCSLLAKVLVKGSIIESYSLNLHIWPLLFDVYHIQINYEGDSFLREYTSRGYNYIGFGPNHVVEGFPYIQKLNWLLR